MYLLGSKFLEKVRQKLAAIAFALFFWQRSKFPKLRFPFNDKGGDNGDEALVNKKPVVQALWIIWQLDVFHRLIWPHHPMSDGPGTLVGNALDVHPDRQSWGW